MVRMLVKLAINALAIWVAVEFTDLTFDGGLPQLLLLALILGLINALVKPIVTFFSLPAVLLSLGLFLLVINIAMFGLLVLLSDSFALGLESPDGFGAIALGGLIVSVVAWVAELVLPGD